MFDLLSNCKPYKEFGMTKEIYVLEDIYDEFISIFENIMVFLKINEYDIKYILTNNDSHIFRIIKNKNRAFTIQIINNIDKFHVSFEINLFYHFHYDMTLHLHYKNLFNQFFASFYLDDNMVTLKNVKDIINGLHIFQKII